MIFHKNRLPADDSHEISCLICYFRIGGKNWNCRLLQIIGGALWAKITYLVVDGKELLVLVGKDPFITGNPLDVKMSILFADT